MKSVKFKKCKGCSVRAGKINSFTVKTYLTFSAPSCPISQLLLLKKTNNFMKSANMVWQSF